MNWLEAVALIALFIGVWHELNRFPATDKSFEKLNERIDRLESENSDLKHKLSYLKSDMLAITKKDDPSSEYDFL